MKSFSRFSHLAIGTLTLAMGILLLPACQQEVFHDSQDDGVNMVINVSSGTRTVNEGDHTLWADDDVLTVIHAPEDGNEFWATPFYKSGDNAFTGKVKRLSSSNDWYVVYPYKEENLSADQISVTFPASQTQTGNENMLHLAGEQIPLWGKVKGLPRGQTLNVQMQNLLAVAGFKVTNTSDGPVTVKQVQFTAPTSVSGAFTVDLTGDAPVLTAGTGATKVVTLNVESGEELAAEATSWFYMAVAPFEAPAGSKLKIKVIATDSDGKDVVFYQTKTLENATSFSSGSIKTVNIAYDTAHTTDPDAGTAGEIELEVGEEPEDGDYLLVYKNGETSMAFAALDEYKNQKYAIPVTVVDNKVLPQEDIDLSRFAITIEKAGIEHPNDAGHDAYNVKNAEDKFIFYASGGSGDAILRIQDTNTLTNSSSGNAVAYYHTFVQTADGVQILSSGAEDGYNQYLLAYSTANGFYYEQENNGQKLHLYLVGGSAKEHQELTFSATSVTYDFDANGEGILTNAPTLSGSYYTDLTWSSSNDAVATVDASGKVMVKKAGTAMITVKAASSDLYYAASASYTITSVTSNIRTWYKADEIVDGQFYLIVSNGYVLQNKGGSIAATAVEINNDVIQYNAPESEIWEAGEDGSAYNLKNNDQYLRRTTSNSSGSWWGGGTTTTLAIGSYSSTQENNQWTYNADGNRVTSGGYNLYYSSTNGFSVSNTTGTSSRDAALYTTDLPTGKQILSFNLSTVRWTVGDGGDHVLDQSYDVQEVSGAATTVTYASSNTSVAIINGTQLTLKGTGATIITATAKEENGFRSASASYTLRVSEPAPAGFEALGTFNLENAALMQYLDDASVKYPADDKSTIANNTYASTSVISSYANLESPSRKDIPAPVVLSWDVASTGTATVTVYNDQELQDEVWTWTASEGSKSFDVYNLIPGLTYYCTVVDDNNGNYLLKGTFNTEGRRRMIKVSDTVNANNANNCRDLGGLKTTDGRRIKYGLIFRGTNMTSTTPEEKRIIAEFMNVGLDNDLRSGTGGGMNRDNPFENTNYTVRYIGPGYGSVSDLQNVSNYKKTIQAFLDAAKPGTQNYQKASYFHCYIGADRTGYTGLMIEGLLGVSLTDCTIDYELTTFSTAAGSRARNSSSMCYIKDAVTFLNKAENGGTGTSLQEKITYYFINKLGISEADIENFKNWALEPDPEAN